MPTGADNIIGSLRLDAFLTNYSSQYIMDESMFVAPAAATIIPVTNQSGKFATYDRSYFLRDDMEPRGLGAAPVQTSYAVGQDTYVVDEFALEHFIDDRQRANVTTPYNLDLNATRLLTQKSWIRRDRQWASTFFQTGVWSSDWTGVGSAPTGNQFIQWDQAASDPIAFIDARKRAIQLVTGKRPNTLVLGASVIDKLKLNPSIVDRIKYTMVGVATEDLLAQLFGVERVVVAQSIYNAAAEGATANYQWTVSPTGVWLGYIERTPALDSPTAVAMFTWTGLLGANASGSAIFRGRDDRAYSDWIHIKDAYQFKRVSPELGTYFQTAVSS